MKIDPTFGGTPPNSIDPNLNLDEIQRECLALMKKRAYVSAGVSAVPVPFLDVVVDAGLLSELLPEISNRFGLTDTRPPAYDPETHDVDWNEVRERSIAFASIVAKRGVTRMTIQGIGTRLLSRQVIKFIPLGGTVVSATMGYFVMKKIATTHINECYKLAKELQTKSTAQGQVVNGKAKPVKQKL